MAHFRAVISGGRGEASRLGSKKSGMRVEAQSWQGKVVVQLDHRDGVDWAEISLARHNNAGDVRTLWEGPVSGAPDRERAEFTLEIQEEDQPVRGNALASGDDATDKACEDEIIERLEGGDLWAWCVVKVTATHPAFPGSEGVDYLGGCSYRDEDDFKAGGYWEDMQAEAWADLLKQAA